MLVTDRGRVVAELRPPGYQRATGLHPGLVELAHRGSARIGAANDPQVYPRLDPIFEDCTSADLLDAERRDR